MTLVRTLLSLFVLCVVCAQVWAQYGYGDGYSYHSSTYAEGVQRGFADVVRSAGEYNLNTSEAAINYTQARSMQLDNRMKATNTYFDMRRVNKQAREEEAGPRLSTEQLYRIAAESAPKRLSSSAVDPLTGGIAWPLVLREDMFTEHRDKLQDLFTERASSGGAIGPENYLEIQQLVQVTLADLKTIINDYPANDYLQAKRFLESLAITARTPST
jgi:hypothetical protein